MKRPNIFRLESRDEAQTVAADEKIPEQRDADGESWRRLGSEDLRSRLPKELPRDLSMWLAFPYCLIIVLMSTGQLLTAERPARLSFGLAGTAIAAIPPLVPGKAATAPGGETTAEERYSAAPARPSRPLARPSAGEGMRRIERALPAAASPVDAGVGAARAGDTGARATRPAMKTQQSPATGGDTPASGVAAPADGAQTPATGGGEAPSDQTPSVGDPGPRS